MQSEPVEVITVAQDSLAMPPAMHCTLAAGVRTVVLRSASRQSEDLTALALRHAARLIRSDESVGVGVACNASAAVATTGFLL